ncbi:sensor histidine kinase [Agrococcus jejuensis]|uniref:sensor histidine kinase n=1 Tax=Agrococcus jejuensis TaxID=399736 RepID=UPI0011A49948|nr:HAMP domain-containing sensor histidine kinase [Agrococcus jejuensis]
MGERRSRLPVVSVRTRIVAALGLVATLAVLAAGVTAYVVERNRILDQVDTQLLSSVESVRFLASESPDGGWSSAEALLTAALTRIAPDDNTGALGVIAGQAALVPGVQMDVNLARVDGLAARVTAETEGAQVVIGTIADADADARADVTLRYVAVPIVVGEGDAATTAIFVTGYDLVAELAELDAAASVFLLAAAIGVLAVLVIGFAIAGRLLRPIRDLRQLAERIAASGVSERVPVTGNDDVSQLGVTVNAMLDRLDGSLAAQQRLLDDVGHELKTPVTIVRGHLELMDARDPADVEQARDVAISELDRMAGLVGDIQRASSVDRVEAFRFRATDVAELTEQVATTASGIEGATVRLGSTARVVAMVDVERITQAMLQLVQNAVTHAGGDVTVASRRAGDHVELVVQDAGPGVPDAHKEAVFERFRRVETGRGREGSGLGLSIVRRIAEAHGGTARVDDAVEGGAAFVVALPIDDEAVAAAGAAPGASAAAVGEDGRA